MRITPRLTARRILRPLPSIALVILSITAFSHLTATASPALAQATSDCTQMPPIVQATAPVGYAVINFTNSCGQHVPLVVDVATNSAEWETGLMGITDLPQDQGELFDFAAANAGHEVQLAFWMEDTPTNLSIAFVSDTGIVQEIDDMQAETTDIHMPAEPYLYAIEANQGWFANNNIQTGSQADLTAALALAGGRTRP